MRIDRPRPRRRGVGTCRGRRDSMTGLWKRPVNRLGKRLGLGGASRKPSLQWQAISFGLIGLSGTAITASLLLILHGHLGWGIALANIPAYCAGIINNYTWNRLWTYRHLENGGVVQQGMQFAAISVCGLIINTAVLAGAVHAGVPEFIAFGIATGVTFCWNFSANHNLTFRHSAAARLHELGDVVHHIPHPGAHPEQIPSPARPVDAGDAQPTRTGTGD